MLATQIEVSDGTLNIINVGIEFFSQADISVSLDLSETPLILGVDYQWSAATTIQFLNSANTPGGLVPAGVQVLIRRGTESDAMFNIYDGGAPFSRLTLDENFEQLLFLSQEYKEGLGLDGLKSNLNMNGFRIVNVGDPQAPGDATNKEYVDGLNNKTLRTPENIPMLPVAGSRANKVLGFDAVGNPLAILPASGSGSELAIDLANAVDPNKGAALVGYGAVNGVPKNIYLKLVEVRTDTDYGATNDSTIRTLSTEGYTTLAQAQVRWPLAQSLNDSLDLLGAERALQLLRQDYSGRPKYLELPPGKGRKYNRALVSNPTFDCNTPVENLTIMGFPGHRAYDTGDNSPSSVAGYGTFDTLFDFRATRLSRMQGVGVYAPPTINRVFHLGARGCANAKQMSRIFTIEDITAYGGQIVMDTYLTSGLFINSCALQRGFLRGLVIDSGGDWEIVETLFNNHGPMISQGGIAASNEFDGACILIVGGGGHGRVAGGKFETSNKGIIIHNSHDILVDGTTIDKMGEYAVRVSTDFNTAGKTILGYQPRGIRLANLKMISAGWIGTTYNCFVFIRNDGTDSEIAVNINGCDVAWGGDNAVDLDPTVNGSPWGVGPTRSGIRAIIAGGGGNEIHVTKNGGDWNDPVAPTFIAPSPATKYLFESYQAGITFENIGQSRMGLPSITTGGTQIGTTPQVSTTVSWTPGSVAPGATATLSGISLPGAAASDYLETIPPSGLAGLFVQVSMSSAAVAVIRLYNPSAAPITGPAGNWVVTRPHR